MSTHFGKKKRWTETEKRTLLRCLKKYGTEDMTMLRKLLPNRSESAISMMIQRYRAIAELGKKDINSPLDVWLRSGLFEQGNYLLPESLLFIYLFEDQPPPEECAGFDLKAAYKFLFEASKRRATNNLPKTTSEMLKQLIYTVDKEIWPANENSITDYLIGKLTSGTTSEKCYKRRKTNENEEFIL